MDFDLYKKIIDEAKDFVFDVNLFHRGESLLHPRIYDMIKYANEKGIYTRLFTNATLLDDKNAKSIIDSGLDFISFSFDGYTKEDYEKVRINFDFDKTINNIIIPIIVPTIASVFPDIDEDVICFPTNFQNKLLIIILSLQI